MRLWHYSLIPYLPNSQLTAQWRELNSIYKNQPRHLLINYVYDYSKDHLYNYSKLVINEMKRRNIKIKSFDNFEEYFRRKELYINDPIPFHNHHTTRYLQQCFYNLQEKYDRGQKDFNTYDYEKLKEFIETRIVL